MQVSIHSGFGGIHGAILALNAKCLGSGRLIDDVRPQTDAELLDASVYATGESTSITCGTLLNTHEKSGHRSQTKFDVNVRLKEGLIRKAMVTYLGAASEFTGNYCRGRPSCHCSELYTILRA
jgi:nuclear pore complex protein Nup205